MTFQQQQLSVSNCCLLPFSRGRHREQQIVGQDYKVDSRGSQDRTGESRCHEQRRSGLPVEPRLQQFAVLYGDLWRRTANSSSRKTAAAVESSLKIVVSYLLLFVYIKFIQEYDGTYVLGSFDISKQQRTSVTICRRSYSLITDRISESFGLRWDTRSSVLC